MKNQKAVGIILFIIVFLLTAIASYVWFNRDTSNDINPLDNEISTSTIPGVTISTSTITTKPSGSTNTSNTSFKVFYVALEDAGKKGKQIGCNDSIVPITYSASTQSPLRSSLEKLLADKNIEVGNEKLYNSLSQSNLTISDLNINNGVAIIKLAGSVSLSGVCDEPRFISQIEETALQFSTVKSVAVYLNNTPIKEALSNK